MFRVLEFSLGFRVWSCAAAFMGLVLVFCGRQGQDFEVSGL